MTDAYWPPALAEVSPLELVETQIVSWLRDDPYLTTLIDRRVYTAVPPDTPYPLVVVEGWTDLDWNTFRHPGSTITVQIRVQSQVRGDYEVLKIRDRIRQVVTPRIRVPIAPLRSVTVLRESAPATYTDDLAGVVTYHAPTILRILVKW